MAAPTTVDAAATTTPHPPPPDPTIDAAGAEPKATSPSTPPPPLTAEPDPPAAAKKRKLEEVGFHTSPYYKIRAAVAGLRVHFLQVYEATDFQSSDVAREILKEIKAAVELSKKMRLDLTATADPVKPSDRPSAGAAKDDPAETIPSGEKNQVSQTSQAAIFPNNAGKSTPSKNDNTESSAEKILEETQLETKSSEMADHPKQLDEITQGSYVIGGSPIGWNFLVWPGGKIVYYGLTKAEWLARQAAN